MIAGEETAPEDVPEELQERLVESPQRGERRFGDADMQQRRRERRRQTDQREGQGGHAAHHAMFTNGNILCAV